MRFLNKATNARNFLSKGLMDGGKFLQKAAHTGNQIYNVLDKSGVTAAIPYSEAVHKGLQVAEAAGGAAQRIGSGLNSARNLSDYANLAGDTVRQAGSIYNAAT